MNILLIAKMGAAVVALFIAYWIGLNDGKNSEELKNARVTISALDTALQEQQAKQKSDALALSNLRIAESRSRDELDWLRQQLSEIERKKTGVFQLPDKMAYVTFNLNVLYRRTAMYVETPGHIKMPGKKSFDRNTSYYLQ